MDPDTIKLPDTTLAIHPLLFKRWSPRAFSDTAIEPQILERIFEAARWAPSSSNLQPWYFLLGYKGDEVYDRIFNSLVEFNQLWASTSPALVIALAKKTNKLGEINSKASYDLGQAMAQLTLQATAEGLYVHQMGGFDHNRLVSDLNIKDDYEVLVVFTIGYRGDAELLHPNLKKQEYTARSRKPLAEFVFSGRFGNKASFIR
jgi:nitroreductase